MSKWGKDSNKSEYKCRNVRINLHSSSYTNSCQDISTYTTFHNFYVTCENNWFYKSPSHRLFLHDKFPLLHLILEKKKTDLCSTYEHLIFVGYLQSTSSFHIMDWKYLCEMVDFSSPPSSLQTKWQQFPVKEVDFFLTIFPPRYWKTLLYKIEDWSFWNSFSEDSSEN